MSVINKCVCVNESSSHRGMYKQGAVPWKDTYRKRCLERLRESRNQLYSKHRRLNRNTDKGDSGAELDTFIKTLMSEELKILKAEAAEDSEMELWNPESGEIDEMLSLFDDIQQELRAEEERLLKECDLYAESLHVEEAALCCAIQRLCTLEVFCPICEKNLLLENKGVIFCKCGLRIDTEQDNIGLDYVKKQLDDAVELHKCEGRSQFSVVENFGYHNLVMTCQICDLLHIII